MFAVLDAQVPMVDMNLDGRDILLQAERVGVWRDGRWLVRNVDLRVTAGEIVTLIGPNGGGKSTTVRAALGLVAIDEGTVRRRPELVVGYVPQQLSIDRTLPLTVERLMSLTSPHAKKEICEVLEWVGLGSLADTQVRHLSGGEFQRALLARAIIRQPDLLVLDEPVQGVDFSGEVSLYQLIGSVRDRLGCGILLISHDLHIVMAATDTVVCINGHICCSGTPESVSENAEYLKLFGSRAGRALAIYSHHHDHRHAADGSVLDDAEGARDRALDDHSR